MRVLSTLCASGLVVLFASLATLSAGCDDKSKDDASKASAPPATASAMTAQPAVKPSAPAPTPSVAPQKSFAEKMSCEALLPERAREAAGFLNYKLSQQATCPECGPTCNLVRPDKPFEGLSIAYTCNAPYDKAAADKTLEEAKKSLAKPVAINVGRGGVMGEKDNGTFYSAVAFDDDSDCKVTVDWMKGDKKTTEPVVKMALSNVKQAMVDAAKK